MSTVESSVRCPQCGRWASQTFDCKVSSWDTGCNYCGYSEYCGPDHRPEAQADKWIHEVTPGYGVLAIQSPGPLAVVSVWHCGSEEEFLKYLTKFDKLDRSTYLWAQATRWNADTRENEIVRLHLRDGHAAPAFLFGEEEPES